MSARDASPAAAPDAALAARLAAVRLLTLDVDGVLTDGRIYVDDDGRETKAYFAGDGIGIRRLQAAGVAVAFVSGSPSPSVRHRADRLGVVHVLQGTNDKLPGWRALVARLGLAPADCAHMGDDLPDLPVLRASGLALTVAHAPPLVQAAAHYVARTPAGRGAVREVVEMILAAREGAGAAPSRPASTPLPPA
jgi:3-deoxy-D-manno-octulosonate 8-phosphate phosphatase (KDO 8-P phosphatase)